MQNTHSDPDNDGSWIQEISSGQLTGFVLTLAVCAVLVPVLASLALAWKTARSDQERQALSYASELLERTDEIGDQINQIFSRLAPIPVIEGCNSEVRGALEEIDASYSFIQMVGVVRNDTIECASYGTDRLPLQLGPVDYVSWFGKRVRQNVVFPFASKRPFTVIDDGLHAVVLHKSDVVDVTLVDKFISLAIVPSSGTGVFWRRGDFNPQWALSRGRLRPGAHETRVIGHFMVSQYRSQRYDAVAVAAVDLRQYRGNVVRFALVLVPIGIAIGLLLAQTVVRVVRIRASLATAIRSGLRNDEFYVLFQPIVQLRDRRWAGAEVLLRWVRPDGRSVSPDIFIPIAEDTGLILAITRRVIALAEPALTELARRDRAFFLSMNISRQDLNAKDMPEVIGGLIARSGVDPAQVHIEITERGFTDTEASRAAVRKLRSKGIRVSIDDFGTGYSGLSELANFELDAIKIDKAFVEAIDSDAVTRDIASHIVELAHTLKLELIAEGIERELQAVVLTTWGVHYGQGWLFSKPLKFDELTTILDDQGG